MRRVAALLAAWVMACGAAPSLPCTASLGHADGADLVLDGNDACPARVVLRLRVATGDPDAPDWADAADAPLRVDGAWVAGGPSVTRALSVTNIGAAPVTLVGLEWASDPLGGAWDRLLHDGYKSWSYTGIEWIPATVRESHGTAGHGGDSEDLLDEVAGVSWWWTALADARSQGLVAGADGATVLKTTLAADAATPAATRLRIVVGMTGDALAIAPGETRALDGLYLGLGDVAARLDDYAARVGALHPPAVARHPAVAGWGSWNLDYTAVTAGDLRDEADYAAATLAPLGLNDFLLDDGYETHWGSWSAAPDFGAPLDALAADERAAGLRPAIWIAPFYVDVSDPLITDHPDWFVRKTDGSLRTVSVAGPENAAVDPTVPEARAFVAGTVQGLRAAGYTTLKIDYLFGGALEGGHAQPVTSLEAYALWMKTIRAAVPDVTLIGCGAPLLPSVGWVDSMRVGPDIAFTVAPTPRWPFVIDEARHVALRACTDAWWSLDPDVVLLRGDGLDDDQAESAVLLAALAGGDYLLGDPREAGALRASLALDPGVLSLLHGGRDGRAARAADLAAEVDLRLVQTPLFGGPGDSAVPHVWRKDAGAHGWLAVFAWEVDGFTAEVDLPGGAMQVTVPAHQARFYSW